MVLKQFSKRGVSWALTLPFRMLQRPHIKLKIRHVKNTYVSNIMRKCIDKIVFIVLLIHIF